MYEKYINQLHIEAKLRNLADFENEISGKEITEEQYLRAKKLGYTDKTLRKFCSFPDSFHKQASYKMVDTCAAEYSATTPYFYSSYDKACESRRFKRSLSSPVSRKRANSRWITMRWRDDNE